MKRLNIWVLEVKQQAFGRIKDQKPFELQVNPESFSVTYGIEYGKAQAKGKSVLDPNWQKNPPRKLSFEFLFDNTGALPAREEPVADQILRFEAITFDPVGKKHKPNYLQLEWGTLIFNCCLESMTVTYKLFAPDGNPLRASVNATFIEAERPEYGIKKTNSGSPDVTHAFTVKEGDSLPLMAEKVYGDGAYYIAVAQANKLVQFRNLKAGNVLVLPPIKKQDA